MQDAFENKRNASDTVITHVGIVFQVLLVLYTSVLGESHKSDQDQTNRCVQADLLIFISYRNTIFPTLQQ